MIALPARATPAAQDAPPATTGTPDRDTPPPVAIADRRRIGELDADYTRLHRAMARSLTQSLRTYAGDLKAGTPAHIAAKAFVQRQTHLLATAYDLAHYEGQRDYHETVSLRPREMPLVEPDGTLRARRLAFYLPSVTKMAREGAEAARERRLSPVTAMLGEGVERADGYNTSVMLATVPQGDALDDWLDGLGVRADLQAGIAWPGLQDGYVQGGAADNANPFSLVYWVLEPLAQHCHDCPAFAAASPYNAPGSGGNELWIAPGDGTSECGAGCRCSLSYEPDTSDEALNVASAQQAYASWLPQGMPQSFAGEGGREVLLKTFAPRLGAQPGPLLDGQKRALDALRGAMADWDTVRGAYPSAPNFFAGTLGAENPAYSIPVDWQRLSKAQQRVILRVLAALDAWDFWTQEAWLNAPPSASSVYGGGTSFFVEDNEGGLSRVITLSNPYPRGPHGHYGEGGMHGMHGSHVGEGRHESRGAGVHEHVAATHHEGRAGGGSAARGSRPFSEHEFGEALRGMRVLPHGQQGMLHADTGIVKLGGREFHVKAFSRDPVAQERLGRELASKEIAHTVGLGAHVPRAWAVEHAGTPYLVSERAPGHALRAIAEHRYPKPEPGEPDPHFEDRGRLEQSLLLRAPEAVRGAIWLHEYVTSNGDAHDGNLMVHAKTGHVSSIDHELSFQSPGVGTGHFSAVAHYSMRGSAEGAKGLKLPRATMESYVRHAGDIMRIAEDHHIDPGPVLARLQVLHNVLRDTPAGRALTVGDVDAAARAVWRQARGQ